jgi:hypothetical protein
MWRQHRVARVSFALLLQRSKALPVAADLIILYVEREMSTADSTPDSGSK